MISMLTGKFISKTPTQVIVDVQGVGFDVQISLNTFSRIQDKESGTLFSYLRVAEDALTLFGFAEPAEREMFIKLISVSGVGAQTARMVLSSMTAGDLVSVIASGNAKALESVKGIGKKTAERLVLELRDKIGGMRIGISTTTDPVSDNTIEKETLEALVALGIHKTVAEQAIQKARKTGEAGNLEELIKLSLKSI